MDAARWERLEEICHAALLRTGPDRAAWLEEACDGDAALRRDALELIAQLERGPAFLDVPLARVSDAVPDDAAPTMIGPYRVVRPLGHGGMGDVVLALRDVDGAQQPVAIKLIRRGMDSDEIVRRFQQERRILASLHHPHIAQLQDAGATNDGRPFLVMEFVEGEPLDEYCERRRLGLTQRLRLIVTICGAVQHAHRNLVIHRDLKPSNILVTTSGEPKLLDFGIGKVLEPDPGAGAPATRSELRVLTPEYAAPEQLRGDSVTTATDVHGLGLLLYRLIAGRHPWAVAGRPREAIEQAILSEPPTRPSRVAPAAERRRLAGDLDTIVLKALHKEPARRYATAAALAEDLERHLAGHPVAARPDTFGYRLGKFVQRNPWGAAAFGLAAAGLAALAVQSRVQSARLARERDAVVEVRDFLLETFGARAAGGGETPVAARELLDQQAATLGVAYADRPARHAEMLQVLAEGYERLGLYAPAEQKAREALALRRGDGAEGPVELGAALGTLGWIRVQQDANAEADTLLRAAVASHREAGPPGRRGLARALNDLGVLLSEVGDLDRAEAALTEALELRRRWFPNEQRAIGTTASNVAALRYRRGDYARAAALTEEALEALRRAVGPNHQRAMIAQSNLATMRMVMGDWAAAETQLRDLVDRQAAAQGRTHPVTLRAMQSLATSLARQGRPVEAESLQREALAAQETALGPTHALTAVSRRSLGNTLGMMSRYEEANAVLQRALTDLRRAYGPVHVEVGEVLDAFAQVARRRGDHETAAVWFRQALAVLDSAVGRSHPRASTERLRFAESAVEGRNRVLAESLVAAVRAVLPDTGQPTVRAQLATVVARLDSLP